MRLLFNDFDIRLVYYVFTVYYPYYGTYYVKQMKRLEETNPRAENEIKEYGLSV